MHNQKPSCGSLAASKLFHSSKEPPLFFIMMRFNIKVALLMISILGFFTMFVMWSLCGDKHFRELGGQLVKSRDSISSEEIDCFINNEYVIGCRKEGDDVFLPFSFLRKYFEIYGKLVNLDGVERFEWSHNSYNKIYYPKGRYDPRGVFMYFENYNVEMRDRVKYVSAIEGVPISTQWGSHGYFYATQIAQFGLSHYSKNLTDPEPRRKVIEDSYKNQAKWIVTSDSFLDRIFDSNVSSNVMKFRTGDHISDIIYLKMDHVLDFVMNVDLMLGGNSCLSVVLQNREKGDIYNLHYISTDVTIKVQENNIYHGIGNTQEWKTLTRDLIVDLDKGLNILREKSKHKRVPRSKLKITGISLFGYGLVSNLTLSTSEHIQNFYNAAEWFVRYQDDNGGWPIPVRRHLANGFSDLQPGWYSSMGQGHALSVLARAYYHSGRDTRYLKAAIAGLKPFTVPSSKGGVLTTFMNKYSWYEEYPTSPPSFVLNGFIYSLLGLYDLMKIAPSGQADLAEELFNDGVYSLKNMITLFDMGSVTSYDLRHFTLSIAPNLARWDYHATHINQLLLLGKIMEEPLFTQTAERWRGYMNGKRAPHN
ncbi:hypothetical protein WA026_007197 [Henosepilachna vigintioctopunctata]|uniref:heparosan-N-sulfate-glucuronate 5-epimerase n=1 Tax=Henosepilachna vigintioctopunctata TaxID=420089 RepID=A0AAW1V8D0_9CUCU